ncbi:hypothetical protein HPDFL43_01690 [Hoeflea phototrophica DFL-43]|uniref:O-Antigen ligase n=1 Tax=Hoeflea phototrophica (strain DSM 17068 / NCIMB 14078 / DFL-43) TaxID=411684 RepID=A9CZX3_HOEPD|nr:hypothetical protein [Hoeflea phototrophica]EDQ34869.1 hypothetical protein HPDFL43_01690 [Hoeflea phototrophica DFL-43]
MMADLKRNFYVGFIALSIMMSMLVGQDASVRPYSPVYFAIVLPALVVPLLWWRGIAAAAMGIGWPLVVLALLAGGWQLAMGDYRAVIQLFLFVWVLLWVCALDVRLSTRAYMVLFAGSIVAGCVGYFVLHNNPWGFLPRMTSSDFTIWRLSFFPSVVLTGLFSLFLLIAVAESRESFRLRLVSNMAGFYFLIFSFVRTAMLAGAIYAPLAVWFSRVRENWRILFFVPVILVLLIHGSILVAPHFLVLFQDNEIVSRLLLRGKTGLDVKDVYDQISRPWIWQKHFEFFLSSPYLMGLGNFDFFSLAVPVPEPNQPVLSGSEALVTRLLATYGWPAFFLIYFMVARLYQHARAGDYLVCAIFPGVVILAMNYGSVLHPSSFLFVLYFQLLIHGRKTFADNVREDMTSARAADPHIRESNSA